MKDISRTDYQEECERIATDIMEEIAKAGGDFDDCHDRVFEDVDGHQWIIYNHYNLQVIQQSDNDDAWEDMGTKVFSGKSFSEICTIVAFYAMLRDVEENLDENTFDALYEKYNAEEEEEEEEEE